MTLHEFFIEPLHYGYMRHALAAALLVSLSCAILGVHIVLRRIAFIGDALAHSALPGLVGAHLVGISLTLGALSSTLITAATAATVTRRGRTSDDSALAIMFTGMFALGIFMMSFGGQFRDFDKVLFGNLLSVTAADLGLMAAVLGIVSLSTATLHKELVLTALDPLYARSVGLKPERLRVLLLVLVSLAVVIGISSVGVILLSALLITPVATARLLAGSVPGIIAGAATVSSLASVAGIYISYHWEKPAGATIILLCTLAFFLSFGVREILQRLRKSAE